MTRVRVDVRMTVVLVRMFVYAVCLTLVLLSGTIPNHGLTVVGLFVVAVAASVPSGSDTVNRWRPVGEAVATVALTCGTGHVEQALLPYLIAPALDAGLLGGLRVVLYETGFASATLLVCGFLEQPDDIRDFTSFAAQWVVLSLAVGLLAAWVRRIRVQQAVNSSSSYAAAYRLLSQLRLVSRQLSGGLDAVVLGQAMLQGIRARLRYARAALFVRSEGGRLIPLACAGTDRVDWTPAIDDDSPWAEAWSTGAPQRVGQTFTAGEGGFAAVLPLRVGMRTIGLVGVERVEAPFHDDALADAEALLDEGALRLETALLFSEIRQIATAEERRRVAREIHDGIAQELASLGYAVDDMSYRATDEEAREQLQALRREITRIISELRLSIFDLRSEVQPSAGLATALSDYARQVGATSHLTVHLVLDESPSRLRADVETELLRIAQEAITNVRKHAGARTLWVTCRIAPPAALLRVEDDGRGLGPGRLDSYGLEIMKERAARIGASLNVAERDERGTVVEVVIGGQEEPGGRTRREGELGAHDSAARR
ncbi:MAG TPA: sensor histidine kinase [Actinomycetes bacterium]|nr:sensor histidine kinase [Actinomycetes bacterium]